MDYISLNKATCNVIDNVTSNLVVIEYQQKIYTATYPVESCAYEATSRFGDHYQQFMLHNEGGVMLVVGLGPLLALINEKPVLKPNDKFQFVTDYSLNIIENELIVRHGSSYYGGAQINDDLKALLLGYIESVVLSKDEKSVNVMIQDFTSVKLEHINTQTSELVNRFMYELRNEFYNLDDSSESDSDDLPDLEDSNNKESKKETCTISGGLLVGTMEKDVLVASQKVTERVTDKLADLSAKGPTPVTYLVSGGTNNCTIFNHKEELIPQNTEINKPVLTTQTTSTNIVSTKLVNTTNVAESLVVKSVNSTPSITFNSNQSAYSLQTANTQKLPVHNDKIVESNEYGIHTTRKNGILHSIDDLPAWDDPNGETRWFTNGVLDRKNGKPTVINKKTGTQYWYIDGKLNRADDKPAIVDSVNLLSKWYVNGKLNRGDDLPAIVDLKNQILKWYTNGVFIKEVQY